MIIILKTNSLATGNCAEARETLNLVSTLSHLEARLRRVHRLPCRERSHTPTTCVSSQDSQCCDLWEMETISPPLIT